MGEFKVTERGQVAELTSTRRGRVIESFGCGTAAVVSPIELIAYKGKEYQVPLSSPIQTSLPEI